MKANPVAPRRQMLYTDGRIADLGGPITIEAARKLIRANNIGTVLLKDGVHVMLIDDDGIRRGLAENYAASLLYRAKCGGNPDAHIYGDAIVVPDSDFA
jgi:adenylylsulfate kinase-like enzyme